MRCVTLFGSADTVDKRTSTTESSAVQTILLLIHVLWILWMFSGVAIAILGFWRPRLWNMPVFRTAHLIGIVATATVPIWNDGRCPITDWEGASRGRELEPFLVRALESTVYWDVSPIVLSLATAGAALLTLAIYFRHPPARVKQIQQAIPKVGRKENARD